MFRNALITPSVRATEQLHRKQATACVAAVAMVAVFLAAPGAMAARTPTTQIAAEECDPIVIPQPAKKKTPTVKKAAQSAPATPLPKAERPVEQTAAVVQVRPKPKPRPKPLPKAVPLAGKPLVIPDACPSAGSNPDTLPTNLTDLIEPGAGSELPLVFPEPAAGSQAFSPVNRLSSLAPRTRSSAPANFGPTVPMSPVGGGGGGGGGGNPPSETTPSDPPGGENPPPGGENPPPGGENPPPGGENPPPGGENPPPGDPPPPVPPILPPPPPVKVPEPGTLGVLLGGLAGMALLRRRR